MNIIQEKIRSVHVFTPPATLGKQRNNFVSRDNFGPYCTCRGVWSTEGENVQRRMGYRCREYTDEDGVQRERTYRGGWAQREREYRGVQMREE